MTPVVALRRAASLIFRPSAWTQGAWARGRSGEPLPACDSIARCFCAEGALYRVCAGDMAAFASALDALRTVIRVRNVKRWNDWRHREHAEVVGALREAAANLEKRQ